MARTMQDGGAETGAGPGPSDEALAVRARRGDRHAFEALVRRHQRAVYGLALRMLGRPEDARDAAQEAFVKAWTHLGRYDEARRFEPWLLTIARNEVRDRLRRRAVRGGDGPKDPEAVLAQLPGSAPDPGAAVDRDRRRRALEAALLTLPPHYREVVVLHHIQGRSVKAIAEVLERPQGTIMTWLYRGRAALKKALEAEGVTA